MHHMASVLFRYLDYNEGGRGRRWSIGIGKKRSVYKQYKMKNRNWRKTLQQSQRDAMAGFNSRTSGNALKTFFWLAEILCSVWEISTL